ncbi:MAG: hypothetical protein RL417_232 [Pseudomonadota bacterium]|jgi:hypothetical protein
MIFRAFPLVVACLALFEAGQCAASGVELEFAGGKKDFVKSSVKAIGKGLERGDFLTVLKKSKTKEDLLTLKRLFYSRVLKKPVELRCRYGAAPRKKRLLDLNHAVEVRVDVPLNTPLKDAALSFSVDRAPDSAESANVLFSFSF